MSLRSIGIVLPCILWNRGFCRIRIWQEPEQGADDIFFYVVANDLFEEMVGESYLRVDYWKYLSEVIIMMYHTAKLFSDMG